MHWFTRICATSTSKRASYRLNGISPRFEAEKQFHRENFEANLTGEKRFLDGKALDEDADGESVVISGISGRFPNTDSMKELKQNLNDGVDMVTENTRWDKYKRGVPTRYGTMKNEDKFDAEFFNISPPMAECMEMQMRKLLEVCFEAVFDAGINPTELRDSRTRVYVGTVGGESTEYWLCKGGSDELEGYKVLGIPNFFQPGRVAYHLDLKGPSMGINTGCSASLTGLELAINAIEDGKCDQAIAAGTAMLMNQIGTMELSHLSALSEDGRCKVFDDSANGFVRSEAVIAILIQKKKHAKRNYATVRGALSNSDGFKREGPTFPSKLAQKTLLKKAYERSGIDPADVKYFEAHGTGTAAGDTQELMVISDVMAHAENRKEPLLLGSVKSNLGHTESAAGLASMAKIVIAINQGVIPANLHFKTPNSFVKDLFDGSFKVVDQPTSFDGGLIGLSSYGLAGSNCHVILESGPASNPVNLKAQQKLKDAEIPILIPFSGRKKELVKESIEEACEFANNLEGTTLLREAFRTNIPGHGYRGYGLVIPGQEQEQEQEPMIIVDKCDATETRPLWFIFPGMGSQWNEMGLMKLDVYAESLSRSSVTLRNVGVDLFDLLRPNNATIFNNIKDSLVAITAVQVALLDTLTSMGLKPDGFVGHSSGEILCAYADGCMSAEEALLVGNARGRSFHESVSEAGGMASVGLTWEEAQSRCPPTIFPACHNAAENVSVSGPLEDIERFVKELKDEGVFARLVNSCGCAPHSKYVYPATELLFKYMNEIFQDDRPRTQRWISSSIPEARWDTPLAKTSSSAYHVNNMQSPVLFHEAVKKVPKNAVVIEIAPRALLQPLLRETVHRDCTLIAPMHHTVQDKLAFFLSSVGKIYNAGVNMDIGKLYPQVQFPVSSSAPIISPLLKWNHDASWRVHVLKNPYEELGALFKVDLGSRKDQYLGGHKLDNRCVFPATGYLVQTWITFAIANGWLPLDTPVTFENVSLERATFLKEGKSVYLKSTIQKGTNLFLVEEDKVPVVRGKISKPENPSSVMFNVEPIEIPEEGTTKRRSLNSDDVYKEFRLRGCNYTGEFRGIRRIENEGRWAQVAWRGNWVSFLDAMFQTAVLSILTRSTAVPVRIKSVTIDPQTFMNYVNSQDSDLSEIWYLDYRNFCGSPLQGKKEVLVPVSIYPHLETIKCPGIEFRGLTAMVIPRAKQKEVLSVEDYVFVPYLNDNDKPKETSSGSGNPLMLNASLAGLFDLVLENIKGTKLKITDVFTKSENSMTRAITDLVNLKPKHRAEVTMLSTAEEIEKIDDKIKGLASNVTAKESVETLLSDTVIVADLVLLDEPSLLPVLTDRVPENSHIILRSPTSQSEVKVTDVLQRISVQMSGETTLTLFKKLPSNRAIPRVKDTVCVDNDNFDWLPKLQSAMEDIASDKTPANSRLYLYSQNNPESGIIGMLKCLRLETGGDKLRCIFDPEGKLNLSDFQNPGKELKEIIEQDLVTNVLRNGKMGSYRHIPMSQDAGAQSKQVSHAYVNTLTTGDLTSLRWVESPLTYHDPVRDAAKGKVCTVHYASINFKDIMLATGKLPVDSKSAFNPQDFTFGFEFSGIDDQGHRVMGVMSSKAMASSVLLAEDSMTLVVPESWTLADAATVPVVYSTAYYALLCRARLVPGQSILIHSGTGGVGQAAISIALDLNCEIFTTVGTEEKKKHIMELFPTLKEENIGHSRDCSFEKLILELTHGRGVDVVLNYLADDKLQTSIRCLAYHGKFLEIGAFDAFQNSNLGMDCFLKNVELHGIFLNHFLTGSQAEKDKLGKHLSDGIKRGVVKPLSRSIFTKDQIEEAFRFMAGGKHMGKVLIEVLREEQIGQKPQLMAVPRSYFSQEKSYVVVGGLGGMGLELANWLVDRGARHLILTSRSGVTTGYQELCLRKWEEKGVKVETPQVDLSLYDAAETFVKELTSNGKQIGGIFNSGLVLRDGPIEEQTIEDFEAVAAPKTVVSKNLDKLTRKYCTKGLDYFVVFSSMTCGRGNGSQSNYGLANSVMEQICDNRKKDGLHGLAIQWGVIGEVGAFAEGIFGAKLTGDEVFEGTFAQRISSCLDVLDMTLHQNASVVSSMVLAEDDGMKSKRAGLLETISHICGIKDMSNITPATKLVDLGMDSLIGIEIKQLIERDYDTPLTAKEIRAMTFNDLLLIEAGTYVKGHIGKTEDSTATNVVDIIDNIKGNLKMLSQLPSAVEPGSTSSKLFIVHGLEGHSSVFTHLAENLNSNVFGYQFPMLRTDELEAMTVNKLARTYIEELKRNQPEGPYQLAGYSSGSTIAFEIGLILENEYKDEVKNLIILDGTCCWKELDYVNDESRSIGMGLDIMTHTFDLSEAEKKGKEQIIVNLMKEKIPNIDSEHVADYFKMIMSISNISRVYEPELKLNGQVTLIKAKEVKAYVSGFSNESNGVQKYCNKPVNIHTVDGNHHTFIEQDNAAAPANIINDILSVVNENF